MGLKSTRSAAGLLAALVFAQPAPAEKSPQTPSPVLLLFSVGGVLTADGTLWQYRPDLKRWMTIDEAFQDQGRETHVLPLPVAADSIAEMSTFGFLRTRNDRLWLYDIERDRWLALPTPTRK